MFLIFSILSLLESAFSFDAKDVSSVKDGMVITADAAVQADGKTHITIAIENQSPYALASGYPHARYDFYCFQIRLKNGVGNYVMQDDVWAHHHAQVNEHPGFDGSVVTGSRGVITILPSEKKEFQFDLEDAYGDRASSGKVLEVYWKNWWDQPVEVWERKGPDGKLIPAHVEPNHFPGSQTFSVSLPLPDKAEEVKTSAGPANEITVPPLPSIPPKVDVSNPGTMAAKNNTDSLTAAIGGWWGLLAIPCVFVIWLGLRLRKR